MRFGDGEIERTPVAVVVTAVTSVVYALVGWGLFRWVRNPRNEELGTWEKES